MLLTPLRIERQSSQTKRDLFWFCVPWPWYLKLNTSCDYITLETLEKKIIKVLKKIYTGRKTLLAADQRHNEAECCNSTKRISTAIVKFEWAAILPHEKQQNKSRRTKHRQTWKILFWVKGFAWKWLAAYIMYIRLTNVHSIYIYIYILPMSEQLRYTLKLFCHHYTDLSCI